MKKFRTVLLWSRINETPHDSLTGDERSISGSMPLLQVLFPGIDYYSITGFSSVMGNYGVPALKNQFPDLIDIPAEQVDAEEEREVAEVLPSKGYEWQDSSEWQTRFAEQVAA